MLFMIFYDAPTTAEIEFVLLSKHMASVHDGKKPFNCSICDHKFSIKQSLTKHIASVHEGKKPYNCSICNQKFSSKQSLTRHIGSVHGLDKLA